MNERLKQLAEQARYDSRNEKHYLERVHNREITLDEYQEIYDKKFAELIVKECAIHLHKRGVEGFGMIEERNLNEHFGVK